MLLDALLLWFDGVDRSGPANMAVDEWLLETATIPVLRIYGWEGEWASIGYFGKISSAGADFPGVRIVRRWTGGGMVDHRSDWTYTLVVPRGLPLAEARGDSSYGLIHSALAKALAAAGISAALARPGVETGAARCFENPVPHDLVDSSGKKLAGAGQRRTKMGLLHQGSVALPGNSVERSFEIGRLLAGEISPRAGEILLSPDLSMIQQRCLARYDRSEWLNLR